MALPYYLRVEVDLLLDGIVNGAARVVFYNTEFSKSDIGTENILYVDKDNKKAEIWDVTTNSYVQIAGAGESYVLTFNEIVSVLGYTPIETETDPTVPSHVKSILVQDITEWTTAFNKRLVGAVVTGDENKNLTLTFGDSTTLTASFTDNGGVADGDEYVNSLNFDSTTGVLTVGRTGVLTDITASLDGRYLSSLPAHTHTKSEITDFAHTHVWGDITGVPNFILNETDPTVPQHVKNITVINISEWNEAFAKKTVNISVTGTSTKTITLTNQDGTTLTGTFTDMSGTEPSLDDVINVLQFDETTGVLQVTTLEGNEVTVTLDGRYSLIGHSHTADEIGETNLRSFISPTEKTNLNTVFGWGDHAQVGYLKTFNEEDPTVPSHVKAILTTDIDKWNTVTPQETGAETVTKINQTLGSTEWQTQLSLEQVQDIVGAMIQGGAQSNIVVTYDDTLGILNFTAQATSTEGLTEEEVEDIVGGLIIPENGITATYDDVNNIFRIGLIGEVFTTAYKNKVDVNSAHIGKVDNPHSVTKAQVGLSNVDNTSDASKPVSTAQSTALNGKVNNSQVLTNVPLNAKFTDTVYTHPSSHPATIITQDASNRFVTDTEKATWSAKETPTGAQDKADAKVQDAIVNGVTDKAPSQNAVFDALQNIVSNRTVIQKTNTTQFTAVAQNFSKDLLEFTADAGEVIEIVINKDLVLSGGLQAISTGNNQLKPIGGTDVTLIKPEGATDTTIPKGLISILATSTPNVYKIDGSLESLNAPQVGASKPIKVIPNTTQYTFELEDKDFFLVFPNAVSNCYIPGQTFAPSDELQGTFKISDVTISSAMNSATGNLFYTLLYPSLVRNVFAAKGTFGVKFISETEASLVGHQKPTT